MTLLCPYCGQPAELITGRQLHPHRYDLYLKNFWRCRPCRAWVGCHAPGTKPLGRLANSELRQAKKLAHAAFDPVWNTGQMSRSEAYKRLARALNLPASQCHIGMFDIAQCLAVVEAVQEGVL